MINLYTLWNAHIFTTCDQFNKSVILGHHISFLMKTREICDCGNFFLVPCLFLNSLPENQNRFLHKLNAFDGASELLFCKTSTL